jgi:hypothetical protein
MDKYKSDQSTVSSWARNLEKEFLNMPMPKDVEQGKRMKNPRTTSRKKVTIREDGK